MLSLLIELTFEKPNYDFPIAFDFSCSFQVVSTGSVWSETRGQDCSFSKHSGTTHGDHSNSNSTGTSTGKVTHSYGVLKSR